ncbi:hypothetical protein H4582DRAFT_2056080 [Lactarius indigo]|nr:hypothetical protein H4582DRAFT_2056080 [Lactarius indigo]
MLTIFFHTLRLFSLVPATAPAAKGMKMVLRCVRSQDREIEIHLPTHPTLHPLTLTLALALALTLSHNATLQQEAQVAEASTSHRSVPDTAANTHPPKHQKVSNPTMNAQPETQHSGHATQPTEQVKQMQT